ncbi:hypothetical protein BDW59DRAFT_179822 [Aspergillus cavernicola]|uniref:PKD domain-containing protein n=1 Tax=Aspergillus cavernicola TaxID=176166 RepID=A0ABR4IDN0_9EURO
MALQSMTWVGFEVSSGFTGAAPECVAVTPDGPLQITADCVDPMYDTPIIANETDETLPLPHHRVSGYFNGTTTDFNIYLPLQENWDGRFFHQVYPLQNSTAEDVSIAFGIDSSGYTVRVAGDLGYRADAATAKFSKEVAREYYGDPDRQIYGYVYGGSGGSFQTIGAMENTDGVWDGAVALIQAIPMSSPNNWCIRALAGLTLDSKSDQIIDAVRAGGSGDPFAGLEEHEGVALEEATALGVPLNAWEDFDGVARNRTELYNTIRTMVIPNVKSAFPTYADDFWTKEGFLGMEESELGQFFRDSLVEYNATVEEVQLGEDDVPVGIKLDNVPEVSPDELEFTILSEGEEVGSFIGLVNKEDGSVYIYSDNNATILANLAEGVQLLADNRWYLAVHTWHRHQVPALEAGYYGYDYLRTDNGQPTYPQYDTLLAPSISRAASGGGTHTGNITGKVIIMDNLGDFDAFPWHADWYKSQVQSALGDRFKDSYRLYYNQHANHYMGTVPQSLQSVIVDFTGLFEQSLRDVSAWVEGNIDPPKQTQYTVENGQVIVPPTASKRRGIQPIVNLTVDGGNRTEVQIGDTVTFSIQAEVPPGTGKVVSVEWDFEGKGGFVEIDIGKPSKKVKTQVSHTYDTAGTFIPTVRVASHRDGDTETLFARLLNLGRVRVIVSESSTGP